MALLTAQRFYKAWSEGNRLEASRLGSPATIRHAWLLDPTEYPPPTRCQVRRGGPPGAGVACFAGTLPHGPIFFMESLGSLRYRVADVEVASCSGSTHGTCYVLRDVG
jgi:hypothetical protein